MRSQNLIRYFCLFALIAFFSTQSWETQASQQPNVLFIAVDDLNDWIEPLGGHPQAETPNIKRLFGMGTTFRHCYCAAPACNPSRVAIMTGLRPSSTGIYHNPDKWRPVLPDVQTIPQHFRRHGYQAVGSGKIFHDAFPDPASWNEYAPALNHQRFGESYGNVTNLNGLKRSHFDWGSVPVGDSEMSDSLTVDYVISQLDKKWEQPFFLACGIYRPHLPWYVPNEYFEKFPLAKIQLPETRDNDLDDVPAAGKKMAKPKDDHAAVVAADQWETAVQGYLASISFTDKMIGRVLDAYEASPHKENTIIVFWTDHGWHLGEKKHWRKFALWEEATRVPLAIVSPKLPAGQVCNAPVNLIDVYPTLIELCDLEQKPELEGESLVPLLKNPHASRSTPSITTHGVNNHSVRSARYRFIQYADGSQELYDHQIDPGEYTNLAGKPEFQQVIEEHQRWLPKVNLPELKKSGQAIAEPKPGKKKTANKKPSNKT